jgi:hypothetical protein
MMKVPSVRLDSRALAPWLIGASITLAFLVRLHFSAEARMSVDLGTAYGIAHDMVHAHQFPLTGGKTTWGGEVVLPGYYYLSAPPLLVSDSPRVFYGWGALFIALGILPFSMMLLERYGPRAGIVGTWYVAFAPWFVTLGDSPWSPKIVLPFVSMLLYCLHRVVAVPRSRWVVGIPLCLAAQAHVYPNLPVTFVMSLAVALICRPSVNWRWFALGCFGAALTVVPTVIHLLTQPPTAPQPAKLLTRHDVFSRKKSALVAAEYVFLYGTAAVKYSLGGFGVSRMVPESLAWARRAHRVAVQTYGGLPALSFVAASIALALLAWVRSFGHGLKGVWRLPVRGWDPMAICLVVTVVVSAVVGGFGLRIHQPRYNFIAIWVSVLPLIWLCCGPRPLATRLLRRLVLAWMILSAVGHVLVVDRLYEVDVPPTGLDTALRSMERIVSRRHGRPFVLDLPYWQRRGWNAMGQHIYGARWTSVSSGAVRYSIAKLPLSREDRPRSRGPGVRRLAVPKAILIESPPPAARRRQKGVKIAPPQIRRPLKAVEAAGATVAP